MNRSVIALAIVLYAGVAVAEPNEAERLYGEGQTAYDAKRYDEAIAKWERSYELSHLPGLVFNLAQAYRLSGSCTKAVDTYHKFIQLDPSSTERATAEGWIKDIEPCTDKPPPPKKIEVPLVPPKHDVVVHTTDRGHGKRVAGVVLGIGGLAILATGAYFGLQAQSLADEVKTACAMGCEWATLESKDADGRRAAQLQYILLGVGAAGLVTSGVVYYLGVRARSTPVAIEPHGNGAVVTWSGRW